MPGPTPYIFFKSDCAEAMRAYARIFGTGEPEFMWFKDLPPTEGLDISALPKDMVMHATLRVRDGMIFASDDASPGEMEPMAGCNIHLAFPTLDEARRVFEALADGGEVRMPFEPTFWSPGFGTLSDKWGIRWMISVDDVSG